MNMQHDWSPHFSKMKQISVCAHFLSEVNDSQCNASYQHVILSAALGFKGEGHKIKQGHSAYGMMLEYLEDCSNFF